MNLLTLLALCIGTLTGSAIGMLLAIPICNRMTDRMWKRFDEQMRKEYPPVPPQALQDKFRRIGLGSWEPTPGVTDEDTQVYLTLNGEHIHVMSVEEALALSDDELKQRLEHAVKVCQEDK